MGPLVPPEELGVVRLRLKLAPPAPIDRLFTTPDAPANATGMLVPFTVAQTVTFVLSVPDAFGKYVNVN
jgi:hypothetical protein